MLYICRQRQSDRVFLCQKNLFFVQNHIFQSIYACQESILESYSYCLYTDYKLGQWQTKFLESGLKKTTGTAAYFKEKTIQYMTLIRNPRQVLIKIDQRTGDSGTLYQIKKMNPYNKWKQPIFKVLLKFIVILEKKSGDLQF